MKWFKHDSNAILDSKLRKLKNKYGMEGYGLYWYCLECIARTVEPHNLTFVLEEDSELISVDTGIHYERVEEMMRYMVQLNLFEQSGGMITCLKMAHRTDEYTQKLIRKNEELQALVDHDSSGQCPDKLRTNSGQTPDSVPTVSRQSPDSVPTNSRQCPDKVPPIRIEENRRDKNRRDRDKKETPGKYGIAENVVLTTEQYDKLTEQLQDSRDEFIDRLSTYDKIDKYKNHYLTILNWWRAAGKPTTVQASPKSAVAKKDPWAALS